MNEVALSQDELSQLDTEQLKQHFAKSLEFTAKHLTYLAQIWKELELRGEDLTELKKGFAVYIPMIAHDRIDASLVIKYAGQKTLLHALAQLPKAQQQQLIDNNIVNVVVDESNNTKPLALTELKASQVAQVFSEYGIRDETGQAEYLAKLNAKSTKTKTKTKARKYTTIKRSDDKKGIIVANYQVPLETIFDLLEQDYQISKKP